MSSNQTAIQMSQNTNMKERSRIYELTGYKRAKSTKKSDFTERFLAFCIDTCIMIAPLYLWLILLLLMFNGTIPVFQMNPMNFVFMIALAISAVMFNGVISVYFHGQTVGKYYFGFKIVKQDNKEASGAVYFLRESFGFGLPFLLLGYFTNVLGVVAYWIINMLCVIFHKQHASLIDLILRTKTVRLMRSAEIKEPQAAVSDLYMPSIDLHIYSNFTLRGQQNVEEIFQESKRLGMKTISITDVNNVKANISAERMSKLYDIAYIPGIYIESLYKGKHVGILGYGIDYKHELYVYLENEYMSQLYATNKKRLELLNNELLIHIDENRLVKNQRFQMASLKSLARYILSEPNFKENPVLLAYRKEKGILVEKFCKDYLYEGGLCYVGLDLPNVNEVIEMIHMTNGKAVLSDVENATKEDIEYIAGLGVDGIEVFSPEFNDTETLNRLTLAKELKLFVSEGSCAYSKKEGNQIADTKCPKDAERIIERFVNEFDEKQVS